MGRERGGRERYWERAREGEGERGEGERGEGERGEGERGEGERGEGERGEGEILGERGCKLKFFIQLLAQPKCCTHPSSNGQVQPRSVPQFPGAEHSFPFPSHIASSTPRLSVLHSQSLCS